MLVVADASPLVVLSTIQALHILPDLYGRVFVPSQVMLELASPARPAESRALALSPPAWLVEQSPRFVASLPKLHAGECEAISLALELKSDVLLIDESAGRKAATKLGLRVTGTVGILELAADRQLVDLATSFDRIKRTDFWVSHALLDETLRSYLHRKGTKK